MMKPILAAAILAWALAAWAPAARAQPAGSLLAGSLLDVTLYGQLERWLGAGPLDLRLLYARAPGDNSRDCHAAADGAGKNFSLLQVSNNLGNSWLIGGYNPQSWTYNDGWHETPRDAQRSAFLFNYTDARLWRQALNDNILPNRGLRQTYNERNHGPTFGAGPDLFVNDRLDTAFSWQVTYGEGLAEGSSIIDGSSGGQLFRIDALEVYSVAVVPEPGRAATFAAGLGVLGWMAWRRRVAGMTVPRRP